MDIATTEMAIKIAIKSPFMGVTKKLNNFTLNSFVERMKIKIRIFFVITNENIFVTAHGK